jgi:hypothetical protein
MMEALVPPKHRFLQEPQGVASQKTAFDTFIFGKITGFLILKEFFFRRNIKSFCPVVAVPLPLPSM